MQKERFNMLDKLNMEIESRKDSDVTDNTDNDADEKRWKYYKLMYPNLNIDEQLIRFKNNRGFWSYKRSENCPIELSGDCFFNFNQTKVEKFEKIISKDEKATKDSKERVNEALNKARENHYANNNCVLMPVTGGMNNLKGKIYYRKDETKFIVAGVGSPPYNAYDRPDVFLYFLNEFYEIKDKKLSFPEMLEYFGNCIFSESLKSFNYMSLYYFLNSFENVYDYCRFFYSIDRELVDKFLQNAQTPISDVESLEKYISLANEFWRTQKNIYEKIINKRCKKEA